MGVITTLGDGAPHTIRTTFAKEIGPLRLKRQRHAARNKGHSQYYRHSGGYKGWSWRVVGNHGLR